MRLPRQIHLASQALPAAGAFTSQNFFSIPAGTKDLVFFIRYTRGAAGGQPLFRAEIDNGSEQSRYIITDQNSLAITAPEGLFNFYLSEPQGPVPADGSAINYVLEYLIRGAPLGIRLLVAESGVTATPGTIQITLTGSN